MARLAGIFIPIPTPFRADDETVDAAALRRNVARWMTTGVDGLVALGSTGEAALLDEDEADRVLEAVRDAIPGDRVLMAGAGRESTVATIAAARRAASIGVDAVLVRTPSFFKAQMTDDVFVGHYMRVADASPVPVVLYNVTMYTGVALTPDAVERLATHANIAGMKESGSDLVQIGDCIARTPGSFAMLAGSAATLFHALCAGCDGAVLALAAVAPEACVQMQALVRQQRFEEALALQQRLAPLARLVGTRYGVPGLKAAMDILGYEGGRPRPPLQPVSGNARAQLQRRLEELGVLTDAPR